MSVVRRIRTNFFSVSLVLAIALGVASSSSAAELQGAVRDGAGAPVAGVQVTATHLLLAKSTTTHSDENGAYRVGGLDPGIYGLRARRVGFLDVTASPVDLEGEVNRDLQMRAVTEDMAVHQLPASAWFARVRFSDPAVRGEFAVQCGMCHQQGSAATRLPRPVEQWEDIFDRMNAMGATLTPKLRDEAPEALNAAYKLSAQPEARPVPPPVTGEAARAVITEWDVGKQTSFLHDVVVGRDGVVYAVDWIMDKLWSLDPETNERHEYDVPRGDVPPGGVLRSFAMRGRQYYHAVPHIAPHSAQIGPDGAVWITLSLGRGLARFDPKTEAITLHDQPDGGMYPHTLRFDSAGILWYTLALSNQVARFDAATDEFKLYRLPTRTRAEAFFVRTLDFWLWFSEKFGVMDLSTSDPELLPIAYGIDIAPDGAVWFSQFNHRRIGRLDPASGEIRMIDTPFYGPRRMRFDSKGMLWIPAYAEGRIYRLDPSDDSFRAYDLPTGRGDMPYALAVDRRTDIVWICGTNSDTIIRFDPATEQFTVYPLPTRVTFTREIDVDEHGNVWTSNSNMPGWQIEGGQPKIIRLSFPEDVRQAAR